MTTGTAGNDTWTIINPGSYLIDGLGGVDTLMLGTSLRSSYTITQGGDGAIEIDALSSASSSLHITLFNVERLIFDSGRDVMDLRTAFGDTTAPTLVASSPAASAAGVAPGSNLVFTFSEAVQRGSGNVVIRDAAGATVATYAAASSGNLLFNGSTLTIDPSADLAFGTGYTVMLDAGSVKDAAGNAAAGLSLSFSTAAPPAMLGGAGNDSFVASAIGQAFDGGGGIDTTSFGQARGAYALVHTPSGFTLTAAGTNARYELTRVERLSFTDTRLALDLDGHAGDVARLIGAVFGAAQVANAAYVGIGLQLRDGGMSYEALAQLALDTALGPNATPVAIVRLLYTNVVGQAPDAATEASFVNLLTSGAHTPASLCVLAADIELNLANINLVGLVDTGLPFV